MSECASVSDCGIFSHVLLLLTVDMMYRPTSRIFLMVWRMEWSTTRLIDNTLTSPSDDSGRGDRETRSATHAGSQVVRASVKRHLRRGSIRRTFLAHRELEAATMSSALRPCRTRMRWRQCHAVNINERDILLLVYAFPPY